LHDTVFVITSYLIIFSISFFERSPTKVFSGLPFLKTITVGILAIPYRIVDGTPMYCVFHRADHDQWQFIAGGGEDNETPLAAAKRETFEEGGVHSTQWLGLKSLSYIPVTIISEMHRKHWDSSTYVIPEYTFGFECQDDVRLSPEHTDCVWLTYDEANQKLKWDSNRTALYELNCRLKKANEKEA